MTDITLDDVALSTAVPAALVQKVTRSLVGAVRDVYQDFPGRSGSWAFPEKPGDSSIKIDVVLVGEEQDGTAPETAIENRRSSVRALAEWASSIGRVPLVVDDEPDRYWEAKLAEAPDPDEWLTKATVPLEFRAGPYALGLELSDETWTAEDDVDHVLTIPDAVEAFPVLELEATDGDLPDGVIVTVNGVELVYAAPIPAGDFITISSVSYTVSTGPNGDADLSGDFDPDLLSMALVAGDWPILQPGNNTVRIVTGGPDVDVVVSWRRRFRG